MFARAFSSVLFFLCGDGEEKRENIGTCEITSDPFACGRLSVFDKYTCLDEKVTIR